MSEPDVEWYIERVKQLLQEIDRLIHSPVITNSIKDIISYDTNEIEIDLHAIVRKLREENGIRSGPNRQFGSNY